MSKATKIKIKYVLPILAASLLMSGPLGFGTEPQSTIDANPKPSEPGEVPSALYLDPNGTITLTTSEKPTPNCPDDTPSGDPDYFWDYGDHDADDSVPGTLKVYADVESDYDVTVYCSQDFIDRNGNTYTEQTQTSN